MPFAELGDVTLHYKTRGDGPVVIGIMGLGLDQRFWAGQIPTVTESRTFVTFDNRGTGRSSGPLQSSIREMSEDCVKLLDHLECESATVLGVSMGGAIAQELTLQHPDRISALVLAMTWARPIEFMRRQSELARWISSAGGAEAAFEATIVRMFTPKFFEIGREAIDQMLRAFAPASAPEMTSPEVLGAQLDAVDSHDAIGRLPQIGCPTLVVAGQMDMIVPFFASEEIAAAIPGAKLVALETGHGMLVEEMDAFNAVLRDFLLETS
jgi:aminoacrylate hydrolase